MNTHSDDWRGEHLIRSQRRDLLEARPHKRAPDEERLERRSRIALCPAHDNLAERLAAHAAAGLTQSQAAAAEGITRSWASELGKFRGITFISHRPKRRKEGSI